MQIDEFNNSFPILKASFKQFKILYVESITPRSI